MTSLPFVAADLSVPAGVASLTLEGSVGLLPADLNARPAAVPFGVFIDQAIGNNPSTSARPGEAPEPSSHAFAYADSSGAGDVTPDHASDPDRLADTPPSTEERGSGRAQVMASPSEASNGHATTSSTLDTSTETGTDSDTETVADSDAQSDRAVGRGPRSTAKVSRAAILTSTGPSPSKSGGAGTTTPRSAEPSPQTDSTRPNPQSVAAARSAPDPAELTATTLAPSDPAASTLSLPLPLPCLPSTEPDPNTSDAGAQAVASAPPAPASIAARISSQKAAASPRPSISQASTGAFDQGQPPLSAKPDQGGVVVSTPSPTPLPPVSVPAAPVPSSPVAGSATVERKAETDSRKAAPSTVPAPAAAAPSSTASISPQPAESRDNNHPLPERSREATSGEPLIAPSPARGTIPSDQVLEAPTRATLPGQSARLNPTSIETPPSSVVQVDGEVIAPVDQIDLPASESPEPGPRTDARLEVPVGSPSAAPRSGRQAIPGSRILSKSSREVLMQDSPRPALAAWESGLLASRGELASDSRVASALNTATQFVRSELPAEQSGPPTKPLGVPTPASARSAAAPRGTDSLLMNLAADGQRESIEAPIAPSRGTEVATLVGSPHRLAEAPELDQTVDDSAREAAAPAIGHGEPSSSPKAAWPSANLSRRERDAQATSRVQEEGETPRRALDAAVTQPGALGIERSVSVEPPSAPRDLAMPGASRPEVEATSGKAAAAPFVRVEEPARALPPGTPPPMLDERLTVDVGIETQAVASDLAPTPEIPGARQEVSKQVPAPSTSPTSGPQARTPVVEIPKDLARGTLIPQVGDAEGYWVGQMRGGTPIAEVGEAMRNSRKTTKPAEVEANFLPAGRKSPSAREVGAGGALASVARGTAAGQQDPDRLADLLLEDLMSSPYRVSRWEEIPGLDRTAGAAPLSPAERVGRLESLLSREVTAIRQLGAHTLSVLLRPDADTALVVQLKQTDGVVEAAVKCDRGDLRDLQAHWPMLREALAEQNIRLLPLQAPNQESNAGNGARAQFSDDRQARQSGSELEGRRSGQEQGQESRQRAQGGSESGVRPLVAQVPDQASPRARGVRRDGWEFWA